MASKRPPILKALRNLPLILIAAVALSAQTSSPDSAKSTPAPGNQPDLVAHETTTFKVHVNEVLLRVVVRDRDGKAIGNLPKEAFQVLDNGKPQPITSFSVVGTGNLQSSRSQQPEPPEIVEPKRYIAYVFDDMHVEIPDLARIKDAASKYLTNSLRPDDRAAIYTTSGRVSQDFTDSREQLLAAVAKIQPVNLFKNIADTCPPMNYYLADLVLNKRVERVEKMLVEEAYKCMIFDPTHPPPPEVVQRQVETVAQTELDNGDASVRNTFFAVQEIIRRVAIMPGERSIVLISPGFLTTNYLDRPPIFEAATRAHVPINTLDVRGLAVESTLNAEDPARPSGDIAELETYRHQAFLLQSFVLADLANGTGGTFVQNTNDLLNGLKRASPPEYSYTLAFQPQGLKPDGKFHNVKIVITNPPGLIATTQKGYFAPSRQQNASEFAKSELENAVFSRDERQDIPVDLKTQFFKSSDLQANVSVLAHVDLKSLVFRKQGDRNIDTVTVVSALFDRNGRFISGQEKTIDFHMRDDVLKRQLRTGIAIKSNFDIQPGDYLVRVVVRDTEGQLLSAKNGSISIP